MPTISVIVPVHNVEDYLEQCLQSLITQNYSDIEILLVDDGSTDRSSHICDSYAVKDNRIKVFHTINRGVAAARNTGIENAKGDFLMFVDGDDWVEPEFCSISLRVALKEDADVVMFGFFKEGFRTKNHSKPELRGEIVFQDRFMLYGKLKSSFAWNKIYRRELFDDVRFPEGYTYEDIPVAYRIFYKSAKLWYIDDILYHYRTRDGSITSTKTHKNENDRYETRMMAVDDLLSWGMEKEAEELKCRNCFAYILGMDTRGDYTQKCIDYFRSDEYRKDTLSWRARLMVKTFFSMPFVFIVISTLFGKRAKS